MWEGNFRWLKRKKSTKGMGGISKTVVYDVKYEDP